MCECFTRKTIPYLSLQREKEQLSTAHGIPVTHSPHTICTQRSEGAQHHTASKKMNKGLGPRSHRFLYLHPQSGSGDATRTKNVASEGILRQGLLSTQLWPMATSHLCQPPVALQLLYQPKHMLASMALPPTSKTRGMETLRSCFSHTDRNKSWLHSISLTRCPHNWS
jgi:hypothetical protein